MPKLAVLLLNLGSPDSPKVPDVRRYLAEFLLDERVIDAPWLVRQLVVRGLILPFRPKKSAEAYASIWTEAGSPLIVISRRQQELLAEKVPMAVELAMRYGSPSVPEVLAKLIAAGVERLFVVPMYPHYAMSSFETAVVQVTQEIARQKPGLKWDLLQPYYAEPDYIDALVQRARPALAAAPFDKVLISFHGIPVRHLRKSDPSHAHCYTVPDCCNCPHPAHATCYRHQCTTTARLFAEAAGLRPDQWFVSFQSRLGRDPWLEPYTDKMLEHFATEGVKRLVMLSPAFVADCLETLEELGEEGKEEFLKAGGESFTLVPCLNDHPAWIDFLARRVHRWAEQHAAVAA